MHALDLWAGRHVGPVTDGLDALLERDAALLGDLGPTWSARLGEALQEALRDARLDDTGAAPT